MRPADTWKDYELLDATDGNRLERWVRPSSSARTRRWCGKRPSRAPCGQRQMLFITAPIRAAASGSTSAVCPKKWKISCGEGEDKLTLIVSPTGFKHTGVFPEQAVNWAWYAKKNPCRRPPGKGAEPVRLHRRCHAGLCGGSAPLCHVDASKGIVAWGKDNAAASGLADRPIRWLVDDCAKFVAREKRRGTPTTASSWTRPATAAAPAARSGSWRTASTTSSASAKRY